MQPQVIALGLPRTGTTSLKAALETLGVGPCLHMDNLFNTPALTARWRRHLAGETADYAGLFEGFQSSTDFPGCLDFAAFVDHYPTTKFILNYRDPADWYESMLKTVFPAAGRTPEQKADMVAKGVENERFRNIEAALSLVEDFLLNDFFGGTFLDKEKTLATYQAHLDAVRATVPADRLLEFSVADGWGPLCQFLGLAEPTEPFPYKNKRQDFQEQIGKMISGGGALTLK
ncbi:sulfotransferase [Neolewinella lacunae]|uniref:Sulfotransferase family protein n=1 Tax=Neolewinella lacunae TaxID=1517758 RepID=A0A923PIL7_9BACT|nr:sulfotransferase family protein [Neolewinella lacunae]MBC6994755.1 sulfotransferase family protein [Neolewinella lacunae]MDN3634377.1 sulfotransferase [Neolewinella lacunae]